MFMLEAFGLPANLTVTVLLFLLRAKKPEDLALLRVLSLSCLVSTLISFVYDVAPLSTDTGSVFFDALVCVLWSTGFLYWFSKALVYYSLFFFAFNRAFEVLQLKRHPLITERQRLVGYILVVFICSLLATAPLLLLAQPHTKDCACAPPTQNLAILTVVYARVFLWVVLLGIICPAVLLYISIALLLRLRRTGRRDALTEDELEQLAFPDPFGSSSPSGSTEAGAVHSPTHASPHEGHKHGAAEPGAASARHVWSA
ncbi:unnamed protein product, partial [Dibothriocephalus latus]